MQAIQAFDEAVLGMKVGGVRRIEVPGAVPALGYSRDRNVRFAQQQIRSDMQLYQYRYGPQPIDLGGQRALDFVLDNPTLQDFNRNLVFDIKLLAIRPR
jgi:FKBP-type peptidyl-prolyl cis-trans isomerase